MEINHKLGCCHVVFRVASRYAFLLACPFSVAFGHPNPPILAMNPLPPLDVLDGSS